MSARGAYLSVLILSLLIADASASLSLRQGALKVLSQIPSWLKTLRTKNSSWISKAWNKVSSYLHSHDDRLHVGEIVDGLSTVQDYFELFGYLNSSLNSNGTFTSELQSAIKNFQKSFSLPVTGQLDDDTVSLIESPRCGLADYTNGSLFINSMKESNASYYKKWWPDNKTELTYAFSPDNDTTSSRNVFAAAFRLWSKETALNFIETTSFNESDIRILFVSIDGKLGVVGGGSLDDAARRWDILFDADEGWALPSQDTAGSDSLDLEWEVVHQIGHALGLTHSSIEEAIMYPFVVPGKERKVNFAEDDLERIQKSPDIGGHVTDGVAAVGPRWLQISPLWLGIMLLFCF